MAVRHIYQTVLDKDLISGNTSVSWEAKDVRFNRFLSWFDFSSPIMYAINQCYIFYNLSTHSLADLGGGVRDARPPLGVQILSISCSFRENLACSRPPWRVHAPPRENPGSATDIGASYGLFPPSVSVDSGVDVTGKAKRLCLTSVTRAKPKEKMAFPA